MRRTCAASFDHPVNVTAPGHVARTRQRQARGPLRKTFNVDTIKPTEITFDPAKDEANIRERGLPFSLVKDEFDWVSAQVIEDTRWDYGERRYHALDLIGTRVHAVVYAPRATGMHVISLRKANKREERRYAEKTESGIGG